MDSDFSREKLRNKNRQRLPDLPLEKFSLYPDFLDKNSTEFLNSSSRFNSKRSSPEIEAGPRHWTVVSEGFPPGVTVDELKNYGRRRQLTHLKPQDNLRLEEGSLKTYKSEYKRRYRAYAPLNVPEKFRDQGKESRKENYDTNLPEYKEFYVNHSRKRPVLKKPPDNLLPLKDLMENVTENNSRYVPIVGYEKRKLLRRSTALKPEGEMTNETEVRREYKAYDNLEKTKLIQRLPSLKMEGEFESLTTEQRDKFVAFLLARRPVFEKKKTSLKMEGDFDFLTEKKLSYVHHDLSERPRIRKRSTSLKLDGEVEFFPEYRSKFIEFPRARPITYRPYENIRPEGDFENQTETKFQFGNFPIISTIESAKPENNIRVEGEMEITPEYKTNFVDFPRERPFVRKPQNQLKPEGDLQILTESSEKYSDVPVVEKSPSLRPSSSLKLEGDLNFLSENTEKFQKHESFEKPDISKGSSSLKLEGPMSFVTEKADKFGLLVPEPESSGRRPSSLKLEGEFLFLPEYKRAFVDFRSPTRISKTVKPGNSNSGSPIKQLKEKVTAEEDSKQISGTPDKKYYPKRLKEEAKEKNLKSEAFDENSKTEKEFDFEAFSERVSVEKPLTRFREFPAFHVLDVKGRIGCQSMMKDVMESEKIISDEEDPTYRLEVFNSGEKGSGFFGNERRAFANPAINVQNLEIPEEKPKQRKKNYVKIVKSPEVPNYLTEESSNKENRWKNLESLSPKTTPENLEKRAFVILDEDPQRLRSSLKNPEISPCSADWMTSLPTT